MAASATERVIGPTVSWCEDIGITIKSHVSLRSCKLQGDSAHSPPALDVNPTVGLMPTRLF